jgi:hypothetical protein
VSGTLVEPAATDPHDSGKQLLQRIVSLRRTQWDSGEPDTKPRNVNTRSNTTNPARRMLRICHNCLRPGRGHDSSNSASSSEASPRIHNVASCGTEPRTCALQMSMRMS